jgi:hypothetical protein
MDILKTALNWRSRKITPIPVRSRSKVAVVPWRQWQNDLPPEKLVKQWFEEGGNNNLGLVCGGATNLVVLDFDDIATWATWFMESIQQGDIKTAIAKAGYRVRTPRGMHHYLTCDEPIPTRLNLDGIDVKGHGSYVLCPPSIHPGGKRYEVSNDGPILRVKSLKEVLPRAMATYKECQPGVGGITTAVHDNNDSVTTIGGLSITQQLIRGPDHNTQLYRGVIDDIKLHLPILILAQRYTTMESSSHDKRWWMGHCPDPDHDDRHPSFRIDTRYNQAQCLTPRCRLYESRGMDVIDLFGQLHNLDNRQSMVALALELGLVKV